MSVALPCDMVTCCGEMGGLENTVPIITTLSHYTANPLLRTMQARNTETLPVTTESPLQLRTQTHNTEPPLITAENPLPQPQRTHNPLPPITTKNTCVTQIILSCYHKEHKIFTTEIVITQFPSGNEFPYQSVHCNRSIQLPQPWCYFNPVVRREAH